MDTLWAHYLADGFEQGFVEGELKGWKNRARQMQNDYSVLHRDWHERGMFAIAWRKVAEDLYLNYYKKMVKSNNQIRLNQMYQGQLKETKGQYS
ncbi:MAG: hypothetical protein WCS16_09625 [Desulfuromonas sp.]